MTLFSSLLLAHVIADFYLQPYAWIMDKVEHKERSLGLFKHICVHVLLTSAALLLASEANATEFILALSFIIITHYAIDIWKTYMGFTTRYFVADQLGHLFILVSVSLYFGEILNFESLKVIVAQYPISNYLIAAIGFALAHKPASILIQLLLSKHLEQIEIEGNGLKNAGELIGSLERLMIIIFILLAQFSAIGFLLAAKSVFRFGDMRRQTDRKLTEYIMLGTLFSFFFAILIGLAIREFLVN